MKSDLDKQSFLNCVHQEPHTMETLLLTTQPTNPCSSWSHKHDEQYEPWPKLSIHRFGTLEFIKGTIHIFFEYWRQTSRVQIGAPTLQAPTY